MAFRIAIDAGHGYNTAGKRTPDGVREWTLNSKVVEYVIKGLKDYNVEIFRSDDPTGKTDKGLSSVRMKNAVNNKVNICLSVHHNAGSDGSVYQNCTGVEVIIHPNASNECKNFANKLVANLSEETGLKSRGVKTSTYFTMCNKKDFPTMIIEGGFMNGKIDTNVIRTAAYQKAYAQAIIDTLLDVYGKQITKKSNNKKPANTNTEEPEKMKTTAKLWLRKTASAKTDSNKIIIIPKGKTVKIKAKSGNWYKVKVTIDDVKYVGFCSSAYLA